MQPSRAPLVALLVFLAGCTPKLDPQEVKEMLLEPSRGVIGGVELGDSWEKIKADHDKRYTVRDDNTKEGTFLQLRHDLGRSAGDNGFFITFNVDPAGKVTSYSVSIFGQKRNTVTVRLLLDDVIAHFDGKLGKGVCGPSSSGQGLSSECEWDSKPGAPHVSVSYLDMSDIKTGSIEISVHAPSKK